MLMGQARYVRTVKYHTQDDIGHRNGVSAGVHRLTRPADASLVGRNIDKNTALYLEEDRSISVTAGSANDLETWCVMAQDQLMTRLCTFSGGIVKAIPVHAHLRVKLRQAASWK